MTKMNKTILLRIAALILLLILGGAGYFTFRKPAAPNYTYTAVSRNDLSEVVDADAIVKPAQDVKLAFERSGKVTAVNIKIGDKVTAGQVLAIQNNSDLNAQLDQANAGVNAAKAAYDIQSLKLQDLQNGPRPEDLQVSQTQLDNAQKSLTDANDNLTNAKNKADQDLNSLYSKNLDILNDASAKAFDALYNKTEGIFSNGMTDEPTLNLTFSDASIENSLKSSKPLANHEITNLQAEISLLGNDQASISSELTTALLHLTKTRNFLTQLNNDLNFVISSATTPPSLILNYRKNLNTALNNLNSTISNINNQQKAIASQIIANKNQITLAENSINQATNNLNLAQKQLKLKQVGATSDQIKAQAAAVNQAQAAISQSAAIVESYRSQLAKSIILAPIDGTVSQQDAKVGEVANMNTPIISIISDAKYQLEAKVSEAEITKLKIGQTAQVTLDADGNNKIFSAKVINIDPSQTIDNGQTTYKVNLEFTQDDASVKDGLSANVKILTLEKKDILSIPSSAIIKRYEDSIVIVNKNGKPVERKIQTGISQNGLTEVTSGLNEGDKIASFGTDK